MDETIELLKEQSKILKEQNKSMRLIAGLILLLIVIILTGGVAIIFISFIVGVIFVIKGLKGIKNWKLDWKHTDKLTKISIILSIGMIIFFVLMTIWINRY